MRLPATSPPPLLLLYDLVRMRTLLFVLGLAVLFSCSSSQRALNTQSTAGPAAMMVGSFTSAAQAARDTDYYAVTLHMYPIWEQTAEPGVTYLYVEQALASMPDRPYRQRVYRVAPHSKDTWASAVYKLPTEDGFVGAWRTPEAFVQLTPKQLEEREGCTVYLTRQKSGTWSGSTRDAECGSTMRGASYATSQVTVSPNRIDSWDQGFDAEGQQVWGAEKGAYEFVRE